MSGIKRKATKFLYYKALHADDTPHRIALGVGIATLVAFTPTMGFQTVIALALAAALRANKAVCFPLVWITNPFTAGPIYLYCWKIGAGILPAGNGTNAAGVLERLTAAARATTLAQMLEWSFWSKAIRFVFDLGAELWVGGCVVGLVSGGLLYGLTLWGVSAYRNRRAARKMARDAARPRGVLGTPDPETADGVRKTA